jgi:hypothetical protein
LAAKQGRNSMHVIRRTYSENGAKELKLGEVAKLIAGASRAKAKNKRQKADK